jgi:hypothetical protein
MKNNFFFFFFLLMMSSPEPGLSSACKKASNILLELEGNFKSGKYVYPPRKYRSYRTKNGEQKVRIFGRNKSIKFLAGLTGIKPSESTHGDYMLNEDILSQWKQWLSSNCPAAEL